MGEAAEQQHHEITQQAIAQSDAVILLLDAVVRVRQTDVELYEQLQQKGKPILVALNKVDEIDKADLTPVVNDAEHKLGTGVIAVSAKTGEGIAERLVPAVMELNPRLAVAIGRALPAYRHSATNRVIRDATFIAGEIGLEPLPLLLGHQLRMVLRIATIFGESFTIRHARELISTIAGGMGIRYLGEQAAKFLPGPGWLRLISAGFAAGGTFAIGKAASS